MKDEKIMSKQIQFFLGGRHLLSRGPLVWSLDINGCWGSWSNRCTECESYLSLTISHVNKWGMCHSLRGKEISHSVRDKYFISADHSFLVLTSYHRVGFLTTKLTTIISINIGPYEQYQASSIQLTAEFQSDSLFSS